MAPEERRAALIAVTVPLLCEHGPAVSTRQIAGAAGVAEGTIFGVFPDKTSLLRAAVITALDPDPLLSVLRGIAREGDLRAQLRAVVELLRRRFTAHEPLIAAIRGIASDQADAAELRDRLQEAGRADAAEFRNRLQEARLAILAGVAAIFEPHRARLRGDPDSAARLLFMLVMATVHAGFGEPNALSELDSGELVSMLLDGLLVGPPAPTAATGDPT
jgi:AcrR family transcriptional regulator